MQDINGIAKTIIYEGLSEIPEYGVVLGALVDIFWPESKEDVWGEIKAEVEATVREAISESVYKDVSEDLVGLNSNLNEYLMVLKDDPDNYEYITETYVAAKALFLYAEPHFQDEGNEVRLLPLFSQFANMFFSLLRDGITNGKKWGWSDATISDLRTQMTEKIASYTEYVNTWYQYGLDNLKHSNPDHHSKTVIWAETNKYKREYTLGVTDYTAFWKYMDPSVYPDPVPRKTILAGLTREIYSDPAGYADDSKMTTDPAPAERITAINIWSWDRLDAVQVKTGNDWGSRMGDSSGGADVRPHGWNGDIPLNNPVTLAQAFAGNIVDAVILRFQDGDSTGACGGGGSGGSQWYNASYEDHILSSVKVMGVSSYYSSADCIVFGFRYKDSYGDDFPDPASLERWFDYEKPVEDQTLLQSGDYSLVWQADGNLRIYRNGATAIWESGTEEVGTHFYFGSDGELKIYGSDPDDDLWTIPTYKDQDPDKLGGYYLILYPTGKMVVVNSNGRTLWDSGTNDDSSQIPESVRKSFHYTNATAKKIMVINDYTLSWQKDGNLVIYGADGAKWAAHTANKGKTLNFQEDGNLVIYDDDGTALWATKTANGEQNGKGGQRMSLDSDGKFAILDIEGNIIWHVGPWEVTGDNVIQTKNPLSGKQ